jgi:hypothetical protein
MPGVGKTAFLAWFLTQIRRQGDVFGHTPAVLPKIVVVSVDRSWHQSSKLWFDLVDWPDIPHYCLQDDDAFNPDRLENRRARLVILREALDHLAPLPFGSLVLIDPIAPFLGGNLLDYDTCMVACTRIRRVCRERAITVIGVSHAGKQKNDKRERYLRLQDRIVGSTAQFGYTDTAMYLASPEETGEKFYTFMWNPHHAPAAAFPMGRDLQGLFVPWLESVDASEEAALLQAFPAAPEVISPAALVLASGLSRSSVMRRLRALIQEGQVDQPEYGKYRKAAYQ